MALHSIEELRNAIEATPGDPELHYDLGNLLLDHGQPENAFVCYRQALQLAPGHPQILLQLGNTLSTLARFEEAITFFQQALHADPANMAAHYNLGNALRETGKPEQAATCYQAALRLAPQDADTHNNLGNVLREMGRLDEAIACYREALRLNPALHHARIHLLHQRQHICDWDGMDAEITEIRRLVREEPNAQISPFAFLSLPGTTAAEQQQCASNWATNRYARLIEEGKRRNSTPPQADKSKLRIGYLSADFRQHPLASLATELMELHDSENFEIYGYSYGANDHTAARARWEKAFDQFIDIRTASINDAAERIHADGIDILVDLTGYTQSSRSGILALRPAPLSVNWLGYPGTFGSINGVPFADYLISDGLITPPEQASAYSEHLVLMPDTYQSNNRNRVVAATPTREEVGLPEDSIVFCCFNQNFKITKQLYNIFINLLEKITNSILWLLESNTWAKDNLQREAQIRGIDPKRIIFAPRMPMDQHLARHRCADLFLDTLPYNAHTTASDALWMGVPVITCIGDTFAARVAASLLQAVGMPELITSNLADYEALALKLATHPDQLAAIRDKLERHHASTPLFDTLRFTKNLESAYRTMWQQHLDGQPRTFSVATPD